jgi:hypothetical protein
MKCFELLKFFLKLKIAHFAPWGKGVDDFQDTVDLKINVDYIESKFQFEKALSVAIFANTYLADDIVVIVRGGGNLDHPSCAIYNDMNSID